MSWWQSVVLGIVEGLTEFLPVSSTGHLLLAQRAMGIRGGEAADAYAVCIQAGAVLAILWLYAGRTRSVLMGLAGRDREGLRLAAHLVLALLPAVASGLLLEKTIKANLFGLWPVVAAWFAGGLAILAAVRWKRSARDGGAPGGGLEGMTWRSALLVGLFQCIAMWPGTSRSLVTILGALVAGMRLQAAVEFSFLLGALTLAAAAAKDGLEYGPKIASEIGWGNAAVGLAVAAVTAAAAVKWMVSYLRGHGLAVFGWYRIALAAVVAGLMAAGLLAA